MGFAENLKQLRKEKQLSQEELAEILYYLKGNWGAKRLTIEKERRA